MRVPITIGAAGVYLLVALAAACSGRSADSGSFRSQSHLATDAAHGVSRDARSASEVDTGAITGATSNAIPCPSARGSPSRKCFAVAHGPFVLTDLEAFAFSWFPTQTQGLQEVVAFPGPSEVTGFPPAFVPRWQTQASEYWGSGWQNQGGEGWNSGIPQLHRDVRAVHGARYLVGDGENLYISVSYRGCWKDDVFERETCSPGSTPDVSATFSGYAAQTARSSDSAR